MIVLEGEKWKFLEERAFLSNLPRNMVQAGGGPRVSISVLWSQCDGSAGSGDLTHLLRC